MVIHHALGVACGAGGVVEGDGVPLVIGPLPGVIRIALGQQRFVIQRTDWLAFAVFRVIHVNDQWRVVEHGQRSMHHVMEFPVGDQYLGFAMGQHEGDGLRVEADIQRIEHGTDHGHGEVGFEHRGNIGQHHGHGIVLADTAPGQGTRQASATVVRL